MNAILPTGVEQYLKEAGFSATEMLVLRKLVEEESLTIRELASKTGKSTGVLDQAMKKLMTKKIAQKNVINDQPRYSINSLDAVLRWVKNDMLERKSTLERRHENFESFIATLKLDKKRPDIEHFHGADGMKQAYLKLLESGQELLTVTPILHLTEEDPFRSFRVEYFRKRQVRKIFQRILAPDSTLARRFQSRDAFEYRKTLLVAEKELPIAFEKTIVGDTIACFNFDEESACFLKYPDLAKAERAAFEALWNRTLNSHSPFVVKQHPISIPLKTRLFSCFREFILSPKSIAAIVLFAMISGVLTFGLYQSNRELNFNRLTDKVQAIALTASLQFDAKDIQSIHSESDIKKPEYVKLVAILNLVRRSDPDIRAAYIMRKSGDPKYLSFVADADSLNPQGKKDLNFDGKLDSADTLSYPGDLYDVTRFPEMIEAFRRPFSDTEQRTDQWGTFISGYAPIHDESGEAIAIVGFDFLATELDKLTAESFSPLLVFLAVFILFLLGRFFALNRSLLRECIASIVASSRLLLFWTSIVFVLFAICYYGFIQYQFQRTLDETGKRLMAIAITAADDFDPADLEQLHFARDMKKEAYQRVFRRLNEIRSKNPEISASYIVRPTSDADLFAFLADADSNFNLPKYSNIQLDDLDFNEQSDEAVWPGYIYNDYFPVFKTALTKPNYGYAPVDKWGATLTGMSPIFREGKIIAILCLDVIIDNSSDYDD